MRDEDGETDPPPGFDLAILSARLGWTERQLLAENSAAHLDRLRLVLRAQSDIERERESEGRRSAWHEEMHRRARGG